MKTKLLPILLMFVTMVRSQNCIQTSYGTPAYTPINDLATGTWNGFMGGLYPNGSNYLPGGHKSAGLQLASQIQPLDANGNPDPVNGKIGFISIGMSNATLAFSTFVPMGNADGLKHPKVKIVDCAEGGMSVAKISLPTGISYNHYWDTTVVNRLLAANVSNKQVQVIWYKEADGVGATPPTPQVYSDSLIAGSKRIMNIIKAKFPNAKICYLASRIYAGYASVNLNPEPYAYWQGWTMKWMIEHQINNDPKIQYSGTSANSPWLCWGTYNWANGTIPRSDGLTWDCPTDFNTDGTHPSITGRQKVATKLLNFLDVDSTACWYRVGGCSGITSLNEIISSNKSITIYPNPTTKLLNIVLPENSFEESEIIIHDMMGKEVKAIDIKSNGKEIQTDVSFLPKGIYLLTLQSTNKKYSQSFIVE